MVVVVEVVAAASVAWVVVKVQVAKQQYCRISVAHPDNLALANCTAHGNPSQSTCQAQPARVAETLQMKWASLA